MEKTITINVYNNTIVYFAPCFANDSLEVLYGLKVTVIGIIPTHENCPKILHWIQVRSVRGPVHSGHIIVLQPGLGASTVIMTLYC
uniref:Uncharacterized protein n=1 Tax=Heterorhabditis bacteriophora TaxID=37862 RepID=A0A1I7XL88_HETBA